MPVSYLEVAALTQCGSKPLPTPQAEQLRGPWSLLGAAGDAESTGSFPRNTFCELQVCCSGIYSTSDEFFLEGCSLQCIVGIKKSYNRKLNQNMIPWK